VSTGEYLQRLGLDADLPPTVGSLVAIHRAHAQTIPYENLATMLGRPPSVVPADSLARVAATGRAGYCFHQNGALECVLLDLGYVVERRHGHVWTLPEHRHDTSLNHLVLVVTGLPTATNPGGRWWPDVGLGEGFLDPVPLVDGEVVDGPFRFAVGGVTPGRQGGWSFANDPTGSFTGLEVRPLDAGSEAVAAGHTALSTPPDGVFTKVLVVQRRDPLGSDTVRCCVATRIDADGVRTTDLTTWEDWRGALDAIGLPLADVGADELHALFDRMLAAHRSWDDAGRP